MPIYTALLFFTLSDIPEQNSDYMATCMPLHSLSGPRLTGIIREESSHNYNARWAMDGTTRAMNSRKQQGHFEDLGITLYETSHQKMSQMKVCHSFTHNARRTSTFGYNVPLPKSITRKQKHQKFSIHNTAWRPAPGLKSWQN